MRLAVFLGAVALALWFISTIFRASTPAPTLRPVRTDTVIHYWGLTHCYDDDSTVILKFRKMGGKP